MITSFLASSVATSTLMDACNIPNTTRIASISRVSSGDKLQIWDTTTGSQVGSTITLTGSNICSSIAMVTPACATVWYFQTSSYMDLVNLNTGQVTNFSGTSDFVPNTLKGQQSAGNTSTGYVMACSKTTANQVQMFNGNTFTVSKNTLNNIFNGAFANTVYALPNGNFIFGTTVGLLVEVDTSFNVISSYQIQQPYDDYGSTSLDRYIINGIAYNNGILHVLSCNSMLFSISWDTKETLSVVPFCRSNTNLLGPCLTTPSSGVVFGYYYTTNSHTNNLIAEVDLVQSPPKVESILYTSNTNDIITTGIQSGIGWAIAPSTNIYYFRVAPVDRMNQTPYITDSTPTFKKGRRLVVINGSLESDIPLPASAITYTISTGKSVKDLAYYNSGAIKLGSVGIYNT